MARKKSKKPELVKIAYGISLKDNSYYEENLEGELLLFDNYEQIAEYAKTNNINFEDITVHEFEVEPMPFDLSDVPEVEF